MIGFLKGKVVEIIENNVSLDVGGVGFDIFCSSACLENLEIGKEYLVYTYMNVKEDEMSLYGFSSKEEKSLFLKLISVSGVGPKTAIGILGGMPVNDVAIAIASSDVVKLSKIKGLGKKTAERIILELKEKMNEVGNSEKQKVKNPPIVEESVLALMSLGFTRAIAQRAVEKAMEKNPKTMEETLTYALQSIK